MDEDTPATQKPPIAKAGPPRGLVLAAVALLIIVAIAGIMLARRNSAPKPVADTPAAILATIRSEAPASSTPQEPYVLTSGPNEVVFEIGSARLQPQANDSIVKFTDSARGAAGLVRMTTRYAVGPNKDKDVALAKARIGAVRHALEANGIKGDRVQSEVIEMPAGLVSARDGGRVELSIH